MTSPQSTNGKTHHATSADLERDVSGARASFEQTITALLRKLAPGKLADGLLDLGSEGGELLTGVGRSIRRHPLPAAVVAIGLGWMLVSVVRSDPEDDENPLGSAAGKARKAAGKAGRTVKSKAGEAARSAKEGAQEAGGSIGGFVKENPLACAMVAVGVGAVLGVLLPMTRKEQSSLGEASDKVKRRVGEVAEEAKERAQAAASAAVETARSEGEEAARREAEHVREAGYSVLKATARAAGEALSAKPAPKTAAKPATKARAKAGAKPKAKSGAKSGAAKKTSAKAASKA